MSPKSNFSWRKSSPVCRLLNTKEFCFLCLVNTQIKIERNGNSSNSTSEQSLIKRRVSLLCLRRHLKIYGISFGDTASFPKHENEEVEANLCLDCEKVVNKFSNLYQQLEIVQMEMDYQLERINHCISEGANNFDLVQKYSKRMTSDLETLSQLAEIDKLRKEISQKCSKVRIASFQTIAMPKVIELGQPHTESFPVKLEPTEDISGEHPFIPPVDGLCPSLSNSIANTVQSTSLNEMDSQISQQQSQSIQIEFIRDPENGRTSCPSCLKTFVSSASARIHYDSVHLKKRWKCDSCNGIYHRYNDLKTHKKTCKQLIKKRIQQDRSREHFQFPCPTCGKRFLAKRYLQKHKNLVHSNSQFPCDICRKTFKSQLSLKSHKDALHFGKTWRCKYCSKEFNIRKNFHTHQKVCAQKSAGKVEVQSTSPTFTRDSNGRYSCPSCDRTFETTAHARGHYASVHLKKKFKCDICKLAIFSYEASLNRHKKVCLNTLQRRLAETKKRDGFQFKCLACNKKLATKIKLNKHKMVAHSTTDGHFKCDVCQKCFKTRRSLTDHKYSVHLKKTYPCKFCNKSLRHSSHRQHEVQCAAKNAKIKLEVDPTN